MDNLYFEESFTQSSTLTITQLIKDLIFMMLLKQLNKCIIKEIPSD